MNMRADLDAEIMAKDASPDGRNLLVFSLTDHMIVTNPLKADESTELMEGRVMDWSLFYMVDRGLENPLQRRRSQRWQRGLCSLVATLLPNRKIWRNSWRPSPIWSVDGTAVGQHLAVADVSLH